MTDWLSRPLYVSINQRLINKNNSKNRANFKHFQPHTVTPAALADQIKSGFAYSYVFQGNKRSKKTFIEANVVSVDVDRGMTLQEAFEHELVRNYATIVYTTHSHTPETHRFRIAFALEHPVRSLPEIEALASALAARLSGDRAMTTAASLCFGNTDAEIWLFDRGLSSDAANHLISEVLGEAERPAGESNLPSTVVGTSRGSLDLNLIIETADGRKLPAKEIREKTLVHCPSHDDENPSAIFNISKKGRRNVYCFVCKKVFAERGNAQGYDFGGFEAAVLCSTKGEQSEIPEWVPDLAKAAFPRAIPIVTNTGFVPDLKPDAGLTFVKSPKSTGKTTALQRLVAEVPKARILVIGHRRSLVRAMCRNLQIDCYLDVKTKGNASHQARFGVCLDSLRAVDLKKPYDYVLIDESEQVLAHFFSDTMADKRPAILRSLVSIITRASNVVALDADLSWVSFGFLADWFNRQAARPVSIYLNQYVPSVRPAQFFQSSNHIIGDLVTNLRGKKRCYVVSNNKAFVDSLSAAIAVNDPEIKFVSITADTARTSGDPAVAFIVDPKAQSRRYQLVLSSPALSSGVDLKFDNNEKYFDVVYGIFPSITNTHLDCDQQLARVRDPGMVKVFLTPETQNFDTDVDVIAMELQDSKIFSYLVGDGPDGGVDLLAQSDDLVRLALPVNALQRASKNRFRENFLEYKRRNGWQVDYITPDPQMAELGANYLRVGKTEAHDRYVERLMNSPKLTDYEIELLNSKKRSGDKLTLQEADSIRRAHIERFYRREIFPGLIELDKEARLRERVRAFEQLLNPRFAALDREMMRDRLEMVGAAPLVTPDHNVKAFLLREALSRTPIFDGWSFQPDVWFHRNELADFREYVLKNNTVFEAQFQRKFGSVVVENETKVLSDLLKHVFLPLKSDRRTGPNGTRPVFYKLDDMKLSGLKKLMHIRAEMPVEHGDEVNSSR
ncbi:plasmid replication protein, CyRepA1 family [Mesorhizobium dulcispinae]|uniref:plasmid replication protein, CyRepA1 family n=1 Tax=Mesorhizobium dulcispinae TaxID=3072316 RepID=UPI002A247C28|nr:plasmid replication protein, CyRepA1 family [Mesorhizobium sp. VK23D]MDX8521117.1 plasmid replication protein, CyRepA1 family [Mesorhizobium sp. VK23D]